MRRPYHTEHIFEAIKRAPDGLARCAPCTPLRGAQPLPSYTVSRQLPAPPRALLDAAACLATVPAFTANHYSKFGVCSRVRVVGCGQGYISSTMAQGLRSWSSGCNGPPRRTSPHPTVPPLPSWPLSSARMSRLPPCVHANIQFLAWRNERCCKAEYATPPPPAPPRTALGLLRRMQ
jgi:hypothetical protein